MAIKVKVFCLWKYKPRYCIYLFFYLIAYTFLKKLPVWSSIFRPKDLSVHIAEELCDKLVFDTNSQITHPWSKQFWSNGSQGSTWVFLKIKKEMYFGCRQCFRGAALSWTECFFYVFIISGLWTKGRIFAKALPSSICL